MLKANPTHVKGLAKVGRVAVELEATGKSITLNGTPLTRAQLSTQLVLPWDDERMKPVWSRAEEGHFYVIFSYERKPIVLDFDSDRTTAELVVRAADLLIQGPDSRRQSLQTDQRDLRKRRDRLQRLRRFMGAVGLLVLLVGLALVVVPGWRRPFGDDPVLGVLFLGYGLLPLVSAFMMPIREAELRLQTVQEELDLLDLAPDTPGEARAQKLFTLHRIELDKYYSQTRSQGFLIFWVGVGAILGGFAIIAVTLLVLSRFPANAGRQQVITAVFGGVGAILANFVAVVYLRMYSGSAEAFAQLHARLVTSNHLHFANFLIAKVSNEDLRNEALTSIGKGLATMSSQPAIPAAEHVVTDSPSPGP